MQDQEAKLQQEILGDAREKAERVRQRAKHEAEKALAAGRAARKGAGEPRNKPGR